MATIPVSQATARFTQALVATYMERPRPLSFLRSFFTVKEVVTRFLRIEVMRGSEMIAVDVVRGSEGNRNRFDKSTEKVIDPPYFREYFDLTELDLYDRFWNSETIDGTSFAEIVSEVADKMQLLVDKIDRAYEYMCAQVLQTGIVTLNDGTTIDFKRKAASLVDGSATPWNSAVDLYAQVEEGVTFLNTIGKAEGGVFNMIMGGLASAALKNNATVLQRGPLSNINLDQIRAPQRNAVGGVLQGMITAGSYNVNLWSYPEYYQDASGVMQPYLDPKNIIILPENPNFVMGFAAVPQLIDGSKIKPTKGQYVFEDYKDFRQATHEYHVKSAGVPIPVAVDQVYTRKVLA